MNLIFFALVCLSGCNKREELVAFTAGSFANEESTVETTADVIKGDSLAEDALITMLPTEQAKDGATLFVHVCGAVKNPGVYEVSKEARVFDVIKMAGGCREDASADSLNLAQCLTDGQRIYVPTEAEVADGLWDEQQVTDTVALNEKGETLVNINTADKEELMTLPGIGEAKAESIVLYRQEQGFFETIEEIKEIRGIKDSVFEKIKEKITV